MSQSMPVAIIGLAGRFPGANTLREFHQVLREGRDCIAPVSKERFKRSTLPFLEEEAMDMGRIDAVDTFDHRFFNISLREAQGMDPHQRLMMELAWEAIESAAYPAEHFHESRTAVIVTNATYEYQQHLTAAETHMISGNTQFAVAGRIARFFNMQGPAFLVDTGCSSGLMGVNMAVDQLQLGRVDTALVLGARIVLHIHPKRNFVDVGVTSHDGRTRSFNADSTGSGSAEAIVSVLLKPLDRALADGDPIQAVISAAGNNSSGQTSASLTATSSLAQSRLLIDTWKRAGIDPRGIEYFEAHGSGTQLGDPIEIKGLNLALREFSQDKHFCGVSSVKTNIGHTDQVAGLSGLTKAVLALRHKQHFPSLHFSKPNPFINFDDSAAFVNTELRDWEKPYSGVRRAGVSSYGFAGNNVHVLLEEAPEPPEVNSAAAPTVVCFSSKRAGGLRANIAAMVEFLQERNSTGQDEIKIQDVARTLNCGRTHFNYRHAFLVNDSQDLERQLSSFLDSNASEQSLSAQSGDSLKNVIFLLSPPDTGADAAPNQESKNSEFDSWLKEMQARFSKFNSTYSDLLADVDAESREQQPVQELLALAASYQLMRSCGVQPHNLLGVGIGELAVNLVLEEIGLETAVAAALNNPPQIPQDLPAKLQTFVEGEGAHDRVGLVELTRGGVLGATLAELSMPDAELYFCVIKQDVSQDFFELLRRLYESGYTPDWNMFHAMQGGRRIELPAYQFEKIACWYREPYDDADYERWLQIQARAREIAGAPNVKTVENTNGAQAAPAAADHSQSEGNTPTTGSEQAATSLNAALETESSDAASNGKDLKTVDTSDWSETELRVAEIWRALLQRDNIGRDDDFFSLGGHSLFGTMVANRIEQLWNIKLYVKDIFTFSTIRSLARGVDNIIREGRTERYTPIEPAPKAEYYPLSSSQEGIRIFTEQMATDDLTFNLPLAIKIYGRLEADRVAACLQALVQRHESFRTSFHMVDGQAAQKIHADVEFNLERQSARESELASIAKNFMRPFDLSKAPLLRAKLVKVHAEFHFLLMEMHHIVFDGSSSAPFLSDFYALYHKHELPGLAIQFKDYAVWQQQFLQEEQGRKQAEYWQNLFKDKPQSAMLRCDFERQAPRSFKGGNLSFDIGLERTYALQELGRKNSSSMFMTLMGVYHTLLAVKSGQGVHVNQGGAAEVVVGTPIAGRQRVELENIPGMFANMLAIRSRITSDMQFSEVLALIRRRSLEAFDNQDYPFESLVDDLNMSRLAERHPLFDTVLHMYNLPGVNAAVGEGVRGRDELELHEFPLVPPTSRYDLTLIFHESEQGLKLDVEYADSLFKAASIEALVEDFKLLIDIVTVGTPTVAELRLETSALASGDTGAADIEILEL